MLFRSFSPVAITYRRYCGIAGEHYQRATCADEGAGVAAPTTMTADATNTVSEAARETCAPRWGAYAPAARYRRTGGWLHLHYH